MLLPSVASLADLDINLGGYSVVYAETVPAPTVTKAFIGTNTISGGNVHVDRVSGKVTRGTVHVTLKDKDSVVKADNLTFTPKSGKNWTVNLPDGVTIAEGDVVTVYQEFDGQNSPVTTANAMESLAKQNKDKLQMPTGEIYIEQTSSNQVNEDEQAEAVQKLKDANTAIAGDIKSVKFSIDTAEHAYYEITYTDGSTSGKVEATNLKIKQVTEYSRGATLGSITIVDNVIKGKLSGEGPFDGIKVQILLKLSDAVKDSYCDKGKCLTDKDTSDPVDATVDGKTGEFTYTIPNPDLKLDQKVGVTVKEPHKFKSCSQTTVKPVVVDKTEVKDPRKLTADDKKAIDAAIRAAYTVNGESKLPNGSDLEGGVPSVIQFDDSGNVKIFSGGDVKGNWDNAGNFIPEKNADGSYKIKEGAEPKITIPAKDLVKNIAPKSPAIEVDTDKGKVTITPPAYKDPGDDTDLLSYTVTYKDASGAEKTVTATRDLDNNTWSGSGVDANTGVITLSVKDIEVGGTVKATAKDNGGLEGDTDKLDSDLSSKKLETATISYNPNSGTGDMEGKVLNKGSEYAVLPNAFKAPDDTQEFKAWEVDGKEVAPGAEITIKDNTVIKALWKKKPVNEKFEVSFKAGEGATGTMVNQTVSKDSKYELPAPTFNAPDGKVFAGWEVSGQDGVKQAGTTITISGNVTLTATWKDKTGTKPGEGGSPGQDKPNKPEEQIPGIKIRDHYTPTFPVYVTVPKTEKVEKAEEVPVSLETHKAYIAGYEDNTLRAEGNLTRAEAAAMVTRLAGLDLSDTSMPAFKDMQKNAWYFRYINAAVKAKMLDADNGMMRPNDKITRAEFAKMLAAIDKENSSVSKFDDIKGHRYEKEINKIYGNNRIEGYEDGSFRPDAYLTRAESAAFLNRMFNRIADKEAYAGLEDKLAKFKDFDASKWYYDEMVEATNSHELTRRGKASDKFGRVYEKWTRILPSDVK